MMWITFINNFLLWNVIMKYWWQLSQIIIYIIYFLILFKIFNTLCNICIKKYTKNIIKKINYKVHTIHTIQYKYNTIHTKYKRNIYNF